MKKSTYSVLLILCWTFSLRAQVTFDRLLHAEREPANWLIYSGNYASHRHSGLSQINRDNVMKLELNWVYQFRTLQKVEVTPIVVDGIMYATQPPNDVYALDTETGRPFWSYKRLLPEKINTCCGQVNRGLAILGDRLYMGTVDAHLVALDARTGTVLWDVEVADYKAGHSVTVAPLAVKDKIIVGISGGEYGIRGFLDAYDANSGKRVWRFYTVPGPGEPGNDTWEGDSWKTGGAPTWVTGSFDPQLNLIYWGTGNPGPDWNGEVRKGDNLYSDCVLALDADSGELKWFFQFTPHDVHDWDSTEIPVLIDANFRGRPRKLMLFANRNAFYYVLDRETGEFLLARPFAQQTWAERIDSKGRPIRKPNTAPSVEGTLVYPGVQGGTNWYSPSYSPVTGLFYLSVWEYASIYFMGDAPYSPGNRFIGSVPQGVPDDPGWGAVRALVPETGAMKWEYRLHTKPQAGILSTATNLVFGGTNEGHFFALDAETGKELWHAQTGGVIVAGPISYLSQGKQNIAIAAGSAIFSFGLEE
ncbi:MAG: pyrroloquinoline quinone-dependent dehydrogenase [Acidobacteriota bacterium]